MAYGTEIVLGIRGMDNINKLLKKVKQPLIDVDTYYEWQENHTLPDLTKAHEECLRTFFGKVSTASYGIGCVTPSGVRSFSPFSLQLYFDPDEMGDEPENAVLGVGLSGRYFPSYLDWRSEHGCIEHVVMDEQTMDMIEKAKEEITKAFPPAKDFEVMYVECHY